VAGQRQGFPNLASGCAVSSLIWNPVKDPRDGAFLVELLMRIDSPSEPWYVSLPDRTSQTSAIANARDDLIAKWLNKCLVVAKP